LKHYQLKQACALSPPDISSTESTLSFMNDALLYKSKRTAKSLWQEYRIYRDRLELQSWILFHTFVVPVNEIQAVEVRPSGLIWGVKLDNCNFCRHVLLIKKSGLLFTKHIGFTPDDPDKFVEICKSILPNG
jgi:hypothetical protein